LPVNGAPFVYQCSELIPVTTQEEHEVCDYCLSVLRAQGMLWGPTHTEIRHTGSRVSKGHIPAVGGPRLIEINARWHAQHFLPVVRKCLGYDAVVATLDSYFEPGELSIYALKFILNVYN